MENETSTALLQRWRELTQQKEAFHAENSGRWTEDSSRVWSKLTREWEDCYNQYLAARRSQTVAQVAAQVNETMHSRFD